MLNSSSISTSDIPAGPIVLIKRLALFLVPLATAAAVVALVTLRSGEFIPIREIVRLQNSGDVITYLPKFSDHTYRLKIENAKHKRPEILVLGPSRVNQWRSAMFPALSFYNAANAVYTLRDFRRFVAELGDPAPKTIIFSIDFYTFNAAWDSRFTYVSYDDVPWKGPVAATIARGLAREFASKPFGLFQYNDPLYGVPAYGLQATLIGDAYRIDGSLQYGAVIMGTSRNSFTIGQAKSRIETGEAPFQFGHALDGDQMREFERFVALAQSKGVKLIGISMPCPPDLIALLDASSRHGIWREFRSKEFADWVKSLGVYYFDFTSIESFAGRAEEFIDPFHASEPAYVRMLVAMMKDETLARHLPNVRVDKLVERLAGASRLEVFKNEF